MHKVLLVLALLLGISILAAQAYAPESVAEMRKSLAYDPLNDAKRLSLAWNLMLQEQFEEALTEYSFVARRDSSNIDAAAGILWSLNSLSRYHDVLDEAELFMLQIPGGAPLYYHRGLARMKLSKANYARLDELKALRLASDRFWQQMAAKALSDSYLALDDLPSARAILKRHIPQAEMPRGFRALSMDVIWGRKAADTDLYALGLKASLGSTRLALRAEELMLNSEHFRWYLHAAILQQFRHLDLSAELRLLDGEDERLYPAKGASLGVSPRIYAGAMIIRPRLCQNVLVTERLNSYQSDLGIQLRLPPISLSYNLAYIYLDKDIVDSDSADLVHSGDLSVSMGRGYELGLYAGGGKTAFSSTSYGGVMDDFEPADGFGGLSLYVPIGKKLSLLLYGQLSYEAGDYSTFYYLRGSFRV